MISQLLYWKLILQSTTMVNASILTINNWQLDKYISKIYVYHAFFHEKKVKWLRLGNRKTRNNILRLRASMTFAI